MDARVLKAWRSTSNGRRCGFLDIDPDKLALVLKYGRIVADRWPALVTAFVAAVATEQGLELPPVA